MSVLYQTLLMTGVFGGYILLQWLLGYGVPQHWVSFSLRLLGCVVLIRGTLSKHNCANVTVHVS